MPKYLCKYNSLVISTVCVPGFRETAFAYSVSSAALVHALARACGRGALERCSCDEAGDARSNREAWRWGGCGDNVKFGLKTSRRFLRSHRWGRDLKARVDHHNSIVGMRVRRRECTSGHVVNLGVSAIFLFGAETRTGFDASNFAYVNGTM